MATRFPIKEPKRLQLMRLLSAQKPSSFGFPVVATHLSGCAVGVQHCNHTPTSTWMYHLLGTQRDTYRTYWTWVGTVTSRFEHAAGLWRGCTRIMGSAARPHFEAAGEASRLALKPVFHDTRFQSSACACNCSALGGSVQVLNTI